MKEKSLISRQEKPYKTAEVEHILNPKYTGHKPDADTEYLMGRYTRSSMTPKLYDGIEKEIILKIHKHAINLRKKKNLGQRKLAHEIKRQFNVEMSEATISNWIHHHKIPYAGEKTQFKPKPMPPKNELIKLYVDDELSASKLAEKYKVSPIIVINWLRKYELRSRTHVESMNTSLIKEELREKSLTRPTKDYNKLTPEKSYIFGVLCGDGHINNKGVKLEIRKDIEFVKEFARCIEQVYGIKYNYRFYKPRNVYILSAVSEILAKDLLTNGGFKTFTWQIPKEIKTTKDVNIIAAFLRGLYDSDGSVSYYVVSLTTASCRGAVETQQLLFKLKIKSTISLVRSKYYAITITGIDNIKKFKDVIGFIIKRKMKRISDSVHVRTKK